MTTEPVFVSIVAPCYNGMRTVRACLDSLSSLASESPSHEIIVVDNGSTDDSFEVIRAHPGVVLVEERKTRGPSAARNAGARVARGDILAFLDIDCVADPRWLAEGVAAFAVQDVVGAGGRIEGVEPKNAIQTWMNARRILDQERALGHRFMPFVQTANAFFRRSAFLEVGGFDTGLLSGEDCDLSWRIQRDVGGKIVYRPDALVYHDHRCSIRGLYRQSMTNAMAGACLQTKWEGVVPAKTWKTSVWECGNILAALFRYGAAWLPGADRRERFERGLDLLHRVARKHGMIRSAWATRQWSQW